MNQCSTYVKSENESVVCVGKKGQSWIIVLRFDPKARVITPGVPAVWLEAPCLGPDLFGLPSLRGEVGCNACSVLTYPAIPNKTIKDEGSRTFRRLCWDPTICAGCVPIPTLKPGIWPMAPLRCKLNCGVLTAPTRSAAEAFHKATIAYERAEYHIAVNRLNKIGFADLLRDFLEKGKLPNSMGFHQRPGTKDLPHPFLVLECYAWSDATRRNLHRYIPHRDLRMRHMRN